MSRAEEKAAAAETARQDAQAAAFWASPIGQATAAKQHGQGFFEIQLVVGSSQRDFGFAAGAMPSQINSKGAVASHAGLLSAIEAVGWRLEHVGYIFVVQGESSREKTWQSGQRTAVSGQTVGIYLFRAVD